MKRILFLCLALAAVLVLMGGCAAGWQEYQARTMTPNINSVSHTRYDSDDYEVLGMVQASGESQSILGLVVEGKDGQGLLMESAKIKYGDKCTGVKDVTCYKEYKAILPIIYNEISTTYLGVAVSE